MNTSKVLGTHMMSMTADIVILAIDESAETITSGLLRYDSTTPSDIRTTKIRYDKNGEAFIERFHAYWYLSNFMKCV